MSRQTGDEERKVDRELGGIEDEVLREEGG